MEEENLDQLCLSLILILDLTHVPKLLGIAVPVFMVQILFSFVVEFAVRLIQIVKHNDLTTLLVLGSRHLLELLICLSMVLVASDICCKDHRFVRICVLHHSLGPQNDESLVLRMMNLSAWAVKLIVCISSMMAVKLDLSFGKIVSGDLGLSALYL